MLIPYDTVICRYNEIALKGKNRWKFEQFLTGRISSLLANSGLTVSKIRGRILIYNTDHSIFTAKTVQIINESLKYVFGLDSFSFALKTQTVIESILYAAIPAVETLIHQLQYAAKNEITFRVRVKRVNKAFSDSKKNLENELAAPLMQKYPFLKVNLKEADISFHAEIHKEYSYIFFKVENGQKGLPLGSNPQVLSLLSGGFDSPVASYLMMKRGVFVDFISFHSAPFTPQETTEKIKRIALQLNKFQGKRRLFLCNLLEVQKEICAHVYETFRTIHYRRTMFRLAERIAHLNENKALVTGESVGQVASQTIINLSNIESAIEMLVLRPLVAMDKHDTMEIARKIGTHDLSAEQLPDSCTVFSPKNPATSASKGMILAGETKLNIAELVDLAYSNTVLVDLETNHETPLSEVFKTH